MLGEAPYKFKSALEAVKTLRAEPNANDQYLPPFVIVDDSGNAVGPVLDGDAVVTINFRADRMVMLAKALEYADFDKFDRVPTRDRENIWRILGEEWHPHLCLQASGIYLLIFTKLLPF